VHVDAPTSAASHDKRGHPLGHDADVYVIPEKGANET
jgi:hypothetical protein